jgi:hypothetical protein
VSVCLAALKVRPRSLCVTARLRCPHHCGCRHGGYLLEQCQLMRLRGADKVTAAAGGSFEVASDLANAERDAAFLACIGFGCL